MAMPARSGSDAVQSWYDEVLDPGYDFDGGGFSAGTGHFTQVVWVGSTHVGAARSRDGVYVVANYLPAGNMMGSFPRNVLPPNSPIQKRCRAAYLPTVG